MGLATFVSGTPSTSIENDNQFRSKRSISNWLPSFLGGSSASDAAPVQVEDEEVPKFNPQIVGPYPDASLIGPIVNRGQVINGQLHYPLWRVHKYNGLHLQPLPISYVHDGGAVQTVNPIKPITNNNIDEAVPLPSPPTSTPVETWLSPELIQMAQKLGVTDFSNLPSLQDAMDVLGTTTRDETIEAIKEFAGTDDGRALIKQFVGGASAADNEVAASEIEETAVEPEESVDEVNEVEKALRAIKAEIEEVARKAKEAEEAEAAKIAAKIKASEEAKAIEEAKAVEAAKAIEEAKAAKAAEEAKAAEQTKVAESGLVTDNLEGANTVLQYYYQPYPGALIAQAIQASANPAQTEEQSELEDPDAIETTTSAGLFGRIAEWTNFLNPLKNRQEIPIPPIGGADIIENVDLPLNLKDENIEQPNTVPLPELPELPELPSVPGAEFQPPPLPQVHIPIRYSPPQIPFTDGAVRQSGGHYVRVKLPLAGFNPTPQYYIDPKYLHHGRNQLSQFGISQAPFVIAPTNVERKSQSIYPQLPSLGTPYNSPTVNLQAAPQIRLTQGPAVGQQPFPINQSIPPVRAIHTSQPVQPIQTVQPVQSVQPIQTVPFVPEYQLPLTSIARPFRVIPVAAPIVDAAHIGQLPLVKSANYEVFKNGPQIVSSYGAPILPHAITLEPSKPYQASPQSPNVYIHQEYDVRPEASEVIEQKIKADKPSDEIVSENNEHVDEKPVNKVKEIETEQRANDNDQITAESKHIENVQISSTTESQPKAIDTEKQEQIVTTEATVEEKPSTTTVSSIYQNLRPKMKTIKTESEKKPFKSNIQRINSNGHANGQIHRADPQAMELLPFTMRHVAEDFDIDDDLE